MKAATLEYVAPRSSDEALAALADGDAAVLAGGQSLVLDVVSGAVRPRRVVDINRVAEFEELSAERGVLRVAPLVRHRTFEGDAVPGALGAMLRTIVSYIGHPPIRARGTMLGSLAYAHPAAEWPVVATVLGAELDLAGPDGRRTVPAERFFLGAGRTARRPEELLVEVRLPVLPDGTGAGFAELRHRDAKYAEVAAMAAVTVADGVVSAARIGLVNVGPCPVRAWAAEQTLIGAELCDAAITSAAETAAEVDVTGGPAARRRVVRTLTRRALTQAREAV